MTNNGLKKIKLIASIAVSLLIMGGIVLGAIINYNNLRAESRETKVALIEHKTESKEEIEKNSEDIEKNEDEIQSTKLEVTGMKKDISAIQKDVEGINHKAEQQTQLLNQMQKTQSEFYINILKEVRK